MNPSPSVRAREQRLDHADSGGFEGLHECDRGIHLFSSLSRTDAPSWSDRAP